MAYVGFVSGAPRTRFFFLYPLSSPPRDLRQTALFRNAPEPPALMSAKTSPQGVILSHSATLRVNSARSRSEGSLGSRSGNRPNRTRWCAVTGANGCSGGHVCSTWVMACRGGKWKWNYAALVDEDA